MQPVAVAAAVVVAAAAAVAAAASLECIQIKSTCLAKHLFMPHHFCVSVFAYTHIHTYRWMQIRMHMNMLPTKVHASIGTKKPLPHPIQNDS